MINPTRAEIREEIALIYQLLMHPAKYNIDLYGDELQLSIRSTDQLTYEVEWKQGSCYRSFKHPLRAVAFFVHYRHKHEIGEDYSSAANRIAYNLEQAKPQLNRDMILFGDAYIDAATGKRLNPINIEIKKKNGKYIYSSRKI